MVPSPVHSSSRHPCHPRLQSKPWWPRLPAHSRPGRVPESGQRPPPSGPGVDAASSRGISRERPPPSAPAARARPRHIPDPPVPPARASDSPASAPAGPAHRRPTRRSLRPRRSTSARRRTARTGQALGASPAADLRVAENGSLASPSRRSLASRRFSRRDAESEFLQISPLRLCSARGIFLMQ